MKQVVNLLPFIAILAFYLLVIRPARSRARAQVTLQQSIEVGQEVMMTSGMLATVAGLDGDVVLLEVAPGVSVRFARAAIARVVGPTVFSAESGDAAAEDAANSTDHNPARSE